MVIKTKNKLDGTYFNFFDSDSVAVRIIRSVEISSKRKSASFCGTASPSTPRRRLMFMDKVFEGDKFYLDPKGLSCSNISIVQLERDIVTLGGSVEKFLSNEVTCVVTDKQEIVSAQGKGSGSKSSPFVSPFSRGQSLLAKSHANKIQYSNAILTAKQLGIRVIDIANLNKTIREQLINCDPKAKWSQEQIDTASTKSEKSQKTKRLKGDYVKHEDESGLYRPVFGKLEKRQCINFEYSYGGCPFDIYKAPRKQPSDSGIEQIPANKRNMSVPANRHNISVSKEHGNVSTNQSVRSQSKSKHNAKKKRDKCARKAGYCESCNLNYTDLKLHITSKSHVDFIANIENFTVLDTCVSSLPSLRDMGQVEKEQKYSPTVETGSQEQQSKSPRQKLVFEQLIVRNMVSDNVSHTATRQEIGFTLAVPEHFSADSNLKETNEYIINSNARESDFNETLRNDSPCLDAHDDNDVMVVSNDGITGNNKIIDSNNGSISKDLALNNDNNVLCVQLQIEEPFDSGTQPNVVQTMAEQSVTTAADRVSLSMDSGREVNKHECPDVSDRAAQYSDISSAVDNYELPNNMINSAIQSLDHDIAGQALQQQNLLNNASQTCQSHKLTSQIVQPNVRLQNEFDKCSTQVNNPVLFHSQLANCFPFDLSSNAVTASNQFLQNGTISMDTDGISGVNMALEPNNTPRVSLLENHETHQSIEKTATEVDGLVVSTVGGPTENAGDVIVIADDVTALTKFAIGAVDGLNVNKLAEQPHKNPILDAGANVHVPVDRTHIDSFTVSANVNSPSQPSDIACVSNVEDQETKATKVCVASEDLNAPSMVAGDLNATPDIWGTCTDNMEAFDLEQNPLALLESLYNSAILSQAAQAHTSLDNANINSNNMSFDIVNPTSHSPAFGGHNLLTESNLHNIQNISIENSTNMNGQNTVSADLRMPVVGDGACDVSCRDDQSESSCDDVMMYNRRIVRDAKLQFGDISDHDDISPPQSVTVTIATMEHVSQPASIASTGSTSHCSRSNSPFQSLKSEHEAPSMSQSYGLSKSSLSDGEQASSHSNDGLKGSLSSGKQNTSHSMSRFTRSSLEKRSILLNACKQSHKRKSTPPVVPDTEHSASEASYCGDDTPQAELCDVFNGNCAVSTPDISGLSILQQMCEDITETSNCSTQSVLSPGMPLDFSHVKFNTNDVMSSISDQCESAHSVLEDVTCASDVTHESDDAYSEVSRESADPCLMRNEINNANSNSRLSFTNILNTQNKQNWSPPKPISELVGDTEANPADLPRGPYSDVSNDSVSSLDNTLVAYGSEISLSGSFNVAKNSAQALPKFRVTTEEHAENNNGLMSFETTCLHKSQSSGYFSELQHNSVPSVADVHRNPINTHGSQDFKKPQSKKPKKSRKRPRAIQEDREKPITKKRQREICDDITEPVAKKRPVRNAALVAMVALHEISDAYVGNVTMQNNNISIPTVGSPCSRSKMNESQTAIPNKNTDFTWKASVVSGLKLKVCKVSNTPTSHRDDWSVQRSGDCKMTLSTKKCRGRPEEREGDQTRKRKLVYE